MFELILTFLVGALSSIVSGVAGGGGGLFVAPALILMGFPPLNAIATAKFGGVGVALGSLTKFRDARELVRHEYVPSLVIITVLATILGSIILITADEDTVTLMIGLMMLGALPFLFMKKDIGIVASHPSVPKRSVGYGLYGLVVVMQAAFSGGIGALHVFIMMGILGCTALQSAATRRIPGLVGALLALAIYMSVGAVDYVHGITMFAGSFIGGYYGTSIALKIGDVYMKWALAGVVLLIAVKLLFG